MIASLRGTVRDHIGDAVLLETGDVGYLILVPVRIRAQLLTGSVVFLYIYDYVREDAHKLYGFISLEERAFFETLLSVSGVGPKVALLILSVGSMSDIQRAVEAGDVDTLTSLPGIGAKTAKKILLELKGKLVDDQEPQGRDLDVQDALVSLGYSAQQARETLRHIDASVEGAEERIRAALKMLSS